MEECRKTQNRQIQQELKDIKKLISSSRSEEEKGEKKDSSIVIKEKMDIKEEAFSRGMSYPSDMELLMLILGKGCSKKNLSLLSSAVLKTVNLYRGNELLEKLCQISGLKKENALALAASIEFGRRKNCHFKARIREAKDVLPYVQSYALEPVESFVCIWLNGAGEIMDIKAISKGTTDKTIVHPREVLAGPVANHASAIICVHNHPSGPCTPSQSDIKSTKILLKASSLMGISFLDHIIISQTESFSFHEHELLENL